MSIRTVWAILPWLMLSGMGRGTAADWQGLDVTASAYTLAADETNSRHPNIAAWGDELKPDMKAVAVSRDLIEQGLTHGARVKIDGLAGVYTVRDKMNKRWRNKIDILMPTKAQARAWGKQRVHIRWRPPRES